MPKRPVKPGSPARPKKKIDKTIAEARAKKREIAAIGGSRKTRSDYELTDELAQHMAIMWTHNLTDEVIYTSLGIPKRTYYKWIEDNRIVTIQINMGNDVMAVTLGLKELKERMKAFFEPKYLVRLEKLIDRAEVAEDFRTASSNLRWLMSKRLPRKYGRESDSRIGIDQIEAISNSVFQIIFRHVKDPEVLGKIQDDLDRMKSEEELKLTTLSNVPADDDSQMNYGEEPDEVDRD
jgi:hypothetical protein